MLIIRNIFISSITFLFFIQLKYKMNGFYKDLIKDIRYFIRYATVPDTLNHCPGCLQSPHYTVHLFNCHNRSTQLCPVDSNKNNFTFRSKLPATAEPIEYSNRNIREKTHILQ